MKRRNTYPGATPYTDRHGKRRWRYRKGAHRVELGTDYGSAAWVARYEAAVAGRPPVGSARTLPGSISAVVAAYYASSRYRRLASSTQATYRRIIERFREAHGDKRVDQLRPRHIEAMLAEMDDRPFAADRLRKLLGALMAQAISMELRTDNPLAGVSWRPPRTDGFATWSEDDIARFLARHPIGTVPHLAMTLMLHTGAARADACRLGWGNVGEGRIRYRR